MQSILRCGACMCTVIAESERERAGEGEGMTEIMNGFVSSMVTFWIIKMENAVTYDKWFAIYISKYTYTHL